MCIIRAATIDDAGAIARLFLVASDRLAAYIWGLLAAPDETLEAVGRRRYARTGVAFSFENALVAEEDGAVIGMAHAYAIASGLRDAPTEEPDPVLRPYAELEAPGSLYLAGLAVESGWRGRGIGARLMDATEARADALGLDRVSLICFEANEGAMRFYRRRGYTETDRRALVPHPTLRYASGDALLMVRDLR
jgi:ribosomal protein S18 acetylase RimI-like enzyme